ncbi:hypothetical protein, partial [Listeria monocytogenes]|uniref:hypothetical protein n=1 Tax=Listeria monocytogenes TaxID=1639 RepID=UPI003FA407B4
MRNTNRALNRIVLFIVAAVLLACGALVIAVAAVPGWADAWTRTADGIRGWAEGIGEPAFGIGAIAALAVIALVL